MGERKIAGVPAKRKEKLYGKETPFNFTVIQPPFSGLEDFDFGLRKALEPQFDFVAFGKEVFHKLPPGILVRTVDEFNCSYGLIRIKEKEAVYLLGPIIRFRITEEMIQKIHSQYGIARLEQFLRIYQGLRIEYDTNGLDFMKNLHKERYPNRDFPQKDIPNFLPRGMLSAFYSEAQTEVLDQLEQQEKLRLEILLTDAIAAGDSKQAILILGQLEGFLPNRVFHDAFLDLKNQSMEANAICKYVVCASQKVQPLSAAQIHKTYGLLISAAKSPQELLQLNRQMVLAYCACVQAQALEPYSPLIQRVIDRIHLEAGRPLSLRYLADICNVNASYLSNLFRKETGMTLTEYINRHRIERSLPLLQYTQMRITEISETVGFLDENYFARTFKRIMGMSPKAFRKNDSTI